jgi:rare lipoprotein A
MNQQRWTCLTALVLSTVATPIAAVGAKIPSPVEGREYYLPVSPQSLPTTTPLTVTELETEPAIPVVSKSIPQVSTLPIVNRFGRIETSSPITQLKIATAANLPKQKLAKPSTEVRPSATTPTFHPNFRATAPILSIQTPIDAAVAPVNPVTPLPQIIDRVPSQPKDLTSFTRKTVSAPISIVRGNKSQLVKGTLPTTIANSATAEAEVVPMPQAPNSSFDKTDTTQPTTVIAANSDRPEIIAVPKVSPIVSYPNDRAEIPSFEAGLPVFIFENERPQQIVNTAIAQVGDTIVAPEPSIAIPVERPKQSAIPGSAVVEPSSIVKIEPPSATIKPALDKIVATQTGQASWYGAEGGSRTANGERYNPNGLTAAHRTLPFGTKVRITSLKTGKFVVVRINDRGPFHRRRAIDLSAAAAEAIGIKSDGLGEVRIEVLESQG